ncbi:MAG TPA: hypothetical protein VLJ79_10700 [Candidatus Binatia bacterium]|nr:hypothetical protein [Candidatus Binatia bacterium]
MSNRFEEIARRKQILVDQCARDREELAANCHRIRLPASLGVGLMVLGKTLKSYPILVAGISSLLVSGYGGKLAKSTGKLLGLGRAILPLWSWWTRRGKRK